MTEVNVAQTARAENLIRCTRSRTHRTNPSNVRVALHQGGDYLTIYPSTESIDKNWKRIAVEIDVDDDGTLKSVIVRKAEPNEWGISLKSPKTSRPIYKAFIKRIGRIVAADGKIRSRVVNARLDGDRCVIDAPTGWKFHREEK
jgi:hypothetical protein